jgi:hypothetical protein
MKHFVVVGIVAFSFHAWGFQASSHAAETESPALRSTASASNFLQGPAA